MIHGAILGDFEKIELESADGEKFELKNNFFTKLAFRIIGLPHVESRIRAKRIFSFIPEKGSGEKILDAGCGYGLHSIQFYKKNFSVYSVDIDKNRIDFLKKHFPKINLSIQDLTKLSFEKEIFDIIICSDVLEHIKEDEKAFRELARVLRKNGILCITVPSVSLQNKKSQKRYGHERIGYRIKDIENLAKKHGLKLVKAKPYSGKLVEKAFEINEKIYKNKFLLGILFYPLYVSSFIEDFFGLNKKHYNGIAYKLIKI